MRVTATLVWFLGVNCSQRNLKSPCLEGKPFFLCESKHDQGLLLNTDTVQAFNQWRSIPSKTTSTAAYFGLPRDARSIPYVQEDELVWQDVTLAEWGTPH